MSLVVASLRRPCCALRTSLIPRFFQRTTDKEGLTLGLTGTTYASQKQSFSITLKCAKDTSSPVFDSYLEGVLSLTWSLPEACLTKDENPGPGATPELNSGLSLGYFFLLCVN